MYFRIETASRLVRTRACFVLINACLATGTARGQAGAGQAWDSVGKVLQTPAVPSAGYVRYNFPRRDIGLTMSGVAVAPAMALGAWAGFAGTPQHAMVMGDLVLVAAEVRPVLAELAARDISVTAVHNHLVGESPTITYVHFHAEGAALTLARGLDAVLSKTGAPRPVTASTAPVTADTARVFAAMGQSGRASGNVVQLSYMLVPTAVTLNGAPLVPALAYGSPVNIQFVSENRVFATGDLAVPDEKVDPVTRAMARGGITATAVHSHLVGERPHVNYIHFWADGAVDTVLAALRSAVEAGR
ncbi:MAG: DUF1259 domain-containing protein [Gemmatimonadaceae bacterium]